MENWQHSMIKKLGSYFLDSPNVLGVLLFGSYAQSDYQPDYWSDIDLLVEFNPDHIPGFFRLAGMEIELSEILGRKADLRTAQDLSRYFRQEVLNSAEVQYAEG